MSKRYTDPIDVEAPKGSVEAFWWRGKRYQVRRVLTRWRESGGWWEKGAEEKPWLAGDAREVVRLEAGNGRAAGTYEIARDLRAGTWTMFRVLD